MGDRDVKRETLLFDRPDELAAVRPAEAEGRERDEGRLLVSTPAAHRHARFRDLPDLLNPGDLLVVNRSATLPASLPAERAGGAPFILNLSTHYGGDIWLAEPRFSPRLPGPLPDLAPGARRHRRPAGEAGAPGGLGAGPEGLERRCAGPEDARL